jgi:hypothetical protein
MAWHFPLKHTVAKTAYYERSVAQAVESVLTRGVNLDSVSVDDLANTVT